MRKKGGWCINGKIINNEEKIIIMRKGRGQKRERWEIGLSDPNGSSPLGL